LGVLINYSIAYEAALVKTNTCDTIYDEPARDDARALRYNESWSARGKSGPLSADQGSVCHDDVSLFIYELWRDRSRILFKSGSNNVKYNHSKAIGWAAPSSRVSLGKRRAVCGKKTEVADETECCNFASRLESTPVTWCTLPNPIHPYIRSPFYSHAWNNNGGPRSSPCSVPRPAASFPTFIFRRRSANQNDSLNISQSAAAIHRHWLLYALADPCCNCRLGWVSRVKYNYY